MKPSDEREQLVAEATKLYNAGQLREALEKCHQCLSLFGEDERTGLEFADFCTTYGSALAESGDLKVAEKIFNSALLIYKAKGRQADVALAHFNLGNVYSYMNSRQRCFDNYDLALKAYRGCGDAAGEGRCLLQLANLYAGLGVFDFAREKLEEVEAIADAVKEDPLFRWSWRFQQAKLALHDGQPERALELFEEALACARTFDDPSYAEETECAIADIRLRSGRAADAIPDLERAYRASKARQDRHYLRNTLELATALDGAGEPERAEPLFDECLTLMERTRGRLDRAERFHWMEQVAGVSQKFCASLFKRGRHEQALEASERGQGRALLDFMFRHQIKLHGGRSVRAAGNGRVILDAPTLSEIRAALGAADAHLFKILETAKGTLAWLVGPDGGIEAWEIVGSEAALGRMFDILLPSHEKGEGSPPEPPGDSVEVRAHQPAQRAGWGEFRQVLSELYEVLFPAGVRARLENGSGRLLVVPHRSFFHVPWAALGPSGGPPLGSHWEVGVTPSVGVFMQLDRRRDPDPWRGLAGFQLPAVAVGGCGPQTLEVPVLPTADASAQLLSFCELPGTSEEATRVAEILNGLAIVGPQAHVAAVRAVSRIAGVLHLATHGYWNLVSGDLSFVVLAPSPDLQPGTLFATGEPAALFAYQLMEDNFVTRAELVALSGCQTGLGTAHPDTYINLAHSFLVAGARSVLVSLWPIRDDASVAFMEEFYLELRDGRSPAEALRRAQAEMSKSVLWNDGWNWSGFVLVGNPFHRFAAEADAPRSPGPAFCGGDFLCFGVQDGEVLRLENFEKERQTSGEAWFLMDGKIERIRKY